VGTIRHIRKLAHPRALKHRLCRLHLLSRCAAAAAAAAAANTPPLRQRWRRLLLQRRPSFVLQGFLTPCCARSPEVLSSLLATPVLQLLPAVVCNRSISRLDICSRVATV
jgi:hypothetical protein